MTEEKREPINEMMERIAKEGYERSGLELGAIDFIDRFLEANGDEAKYEIFLRLICFSDNLSKSYQKVSAGLACRDISWLKLIDSNRLN